MIAANLKVVGTNIYIKHRLIGEFARSTSDMIEYLYDQLQPPRLQPPNGGELS